MENIYEKKIEELNKASSFLKDTSTVIGSFIGFISALVTIFLWISELSLKLKLLYTTAAIFLILIIIIVILISKVRDCKKIGLLIIDDNKTLNERVFETTNQIKDLQDKVNTLNNNKEVILKSNEKYKKRSATYKSGYTSLLGCIEDAYVILPNNDIVKNFKVNSNEVHRRILSELEEETWINIK